MSFRNRTARCSTALVILAALVPGCGGEVDLGTEGFSQLEDALYFTNSGLRWPASADHPGSGRGADIPVCYKTPGAIAGSNDEKARVAIVENVRNWTENTWGRVADINFHGWGKCSGSAGGRMVMNIQATGSAVNATLGYQGSGSDTNVNLDANVNHVTVVHEIGHALGFLHEFNRDDWTRTDQGSVSCRTNADCVAAGTANFGDTCMKAAGAATGFCRAPNSGTKVTPVADFDSSLAATWVNNATNSSTEATPTSALSPWDVIGAQVVYGPKPRRALVGLGGRCANISGASTANGASVIAWTCVGASNDKFKRADGEQMMATISGKNRCLNVKGGVVKANGSTPVVAWDCLDGYANESFEFKGAQLRAMGNQCVTATGTTAGSKLELRRCGSVATDRERWDLIGNTIRLSKSGLCASVPKVNAGQANALGTRVTLRTCANDNGQVLALNNSTVKAQNMCWNVLGGLPTSGSGIGLWDSCNPEGANDRFYVSGPVKSLGQCLDMLGGVSKQGTNIGMYPCVANAPNEQWDYYW